jgi:hypothetical protein
MGYGSRALELLEKYFLGKMTDLTESSASENHEAPTVDPAVRFFPYTSITLFYLEFLDHAIAFYE